MEPYDMVCLSNDFDYFCFPCGTLKLRNQPKPLFNPTVESSIGNENKLASNEEKVKNLWDRLARVSGKMKLELCYSENVKKCALCKEYI